MLRRCFAIVALGLLWVSAAAAQPADYVGHFGQEDANLLVIADPLPHLKGLLTDPRVKRVIAGEVGRAAGQPGLDTQPWWEAIERVQINIPRQIVIGVSRSATSDFDHLVRTGIWLGLCAGAVEAEDAAEADLPRLQDNLAAEIRRLRMPRVRIWIAMRDANSAIGFMNLLRWQAPNFADQPGLTINADLKRITVEGDLSKLTDESMRMEILEDMGAIVDDEDPKAKALSDAIAALRFSAMLEQKADGLLLTLGSPGDDRPLREEDLPALMRPAPGVVLTARWDIAALKKASAEWVAIWKQWADTPAGEAAAELDDEDLIGDLHLLARQLASQADRGILRVWQEKDLHVQIEETGVPPAKPLADAKLVRAVPAGVQAMFLDGRKSLAQSLSDALSNFEERLSAQWLRATLDGNEERAERADELALAYYEHLSEFRTLVHEQLRERFAAPTAYLVDSRGSIRRFTAEFLEDGEPRRFVGENLPVHQVAILAQATDPKAADAAVREMAARFVQGLCAAAEVEQPKNPATVREADLGLGIPTRVFDSTWITAISGPDRVKITAEGDLVAHYFLLDDLLVFSTSPAMSRRIVSAYRGTDRMDAAPLRGEQVVAWAHVPGTTFAAFFDHLAAWSKAMTPEQADGAQIMAASSALVRLIDAVESRTIQAGVNQTTRARVRFVAE